VQQQLANLKAPEVDILALPSNYQFNVANNSF
jgi:hypothetical protein